MKYKILIPAMLLALALIPAAATMKEKTLKQTLVLKMPDGSGTNGAGVAYNPLKKYYYAAFAGNEGYPMATFDAKGKMLNGDKTCQFDVRGLWFNSKLNRIEGNPYDYTSGYYYVSLTEKGFPNTVDNIFTPDEYAEETYQPEDNSIGAYIAASDEVVFKYGTELHYYNRSNGTFKRKVDLKNLPVSEENLNTYAVVYTGIPKMEIGVLDYVLKKIYLFNATTNEYSKSITLPKTAVCEGSFNFSYCNGIYWLFNISERKWYGYK